jgi:succinate-semialdehyde dehydrogenase/glutarate-semialdehyde dehydrogenase
MLRVINPTSGELLHEYPALDRASMNSRIDMANRAFTDWQKSCIRSQP